MSATEIKKGSWVSIKWTNRPAVTGQVVDTTGVLKIKLGTGLFVYEFKGSKHVSNDSETMPPPPPFAVDSWVSHVVFGKGQVTKIISTTMVEVKFVDFKGKGVVKTSLMANDQLGQIRPPQMRL